MCACVCPVVAGVSADCCTCVRQQIFAAAAVIALGLCAVAFVATSGDASPAEDSISNIYAGYAKQAALHRHTTKLAMGPGLEADDMKDIQVTIGAHHQLALSFCPLEPNRRPWCCWSLAARKGYR